MVLKESGQIKAQNTNLPSADEENRVPSDVGEGGDVTVSVNGDKNGDLFQESVGEGNGVVGVIGSGPPRLGPVVSLGNFLEETEFGEIDENVELLHGGGAPIGEAGADGEALLEDGAKVGGEGESEGGFEGCEFGVGEAGEDRDLEGFEVVDDGLGVGREGETGQFWPWRLRGGGAGAGA